MSSLFAALAIPAAKSAVESVRSVAASAERSFADALRTASEFCGANAQELHDDQADAGERDAIASRIAEQLQGLCEAAGAQPGESIQITVDEDGTAAVDGDSAASSAVEELLLADPTLPADLAALARRDDRFAEGSSAPVLQIEMHLAGGPPSIAWQ